MEPPIYRLYFKYYHFFGRYAPKNLMKSSYYHRGRDNRKRNVIIKISC